MQEERYSHCNMGAGLFPWTEMCMLTAMVNSSVSYNVQYITTEACTNIQNCGTTYGLHHNFMFKDLHKFTRLLFTLLQLYLL